MDDNFMLIDEIFEEYKSVGDLDILQVPEPERTVMTVYSAHGVINNGGFRFFFENDFEGHYGYDVFIDSFQKIGLSNYSKAIKDILAVFPDGKPHEDLDERRSFLAKFFEVESSEYLPAVEDADNLFFNENKLPYGKALEFYKLNK